MKLRNATIFLWQAESFIIMSWPRPLSYFMSTSTLLAYIFTAPTCTTTIITLKPCALYAEFQHCIPKFYIKLPYFADLTQRGDRGWQEAQRQGDLKENSTIAIYICLFQWYFVWLFSLSYICLNLSSLVGNWDLRPQCPKPITLSFTFL